MSRFKPRRFEVFIVAGLIFGLCFVLFFAFERARKNARQATCLMNMKQIGLATNQYVRDYDEKFPLAKSWHEDLMPYAKKETVFHCPARVSYGYAFNGRISRLSLGLIESINGDDERDTTPMFFESSLQRDNVTDSGQSWPKQEIHPKGNAVVFTDGHAELQMKKPLFRAFAPLPKPKPQKKARKKLGRRP